MIRSVSDPSYSETAAKSAKPVHFSACGCSALISTFSADVEFGAATLSIAKESGGGTAEAEVG